jgi:hypothetical protein
MSAAASHFQQNGCMQGESMCVVRFPIKQSHAARDRQKNPMRAHPRK